MTQTRSAARIVIAARPGRRGPASARRGFSLMEVLISAFLLTIGVLALAAMIPLGRLAIAEAFKADYAGACGRAAMHDVKIRGMANPQYWSATNNTGCVVIDPQGILNGMTGAFGGVPRVNLAYPNAAGSLVPYDLNMANLVFNSHDDLKINTPTNKALGPSIVRDATGAPVTEQNYSWLATVEPAPSEAALGPDQRNHFVVSVVVCYQRGFTTTDEISATLTPGTGGSATLGTPLPVKENDWVAVCGGGKCRWYRVVAAGTTPGAQSGGATFLSLDGPDFPPGANLAVMIRTRVIGVYTTTVEVDRDPSWMK
jgi:hypothetical protein